MRIVFLGTPDFAVPTLAGILGAGHEVAAVYTQPPRPAGRGLAPRPSPVARFAEAHGIAVRTPRTLRDPEAQADFAALGADAAVVVAYGLILPRAVLDAPAQGCFNLHASLLPRWRGAAPIQRAVMAGDAETGVTIMRMEEGLDTGPICRADGVALVERVATGADETAGALHDHLARLGAELMLRALDALGRGTLTCAPQPAEGVTYARKIDKAETRIDWTRPAPQVHDHIRGLSPFPGAWFEMPTADGPVRVKALRSTRAERDTRDTAGEGSVPGEVLDEHLTVACGKGAVRLLELQRAGRSAMSAEEFLRGTPLAPGTRLA